MKKLISILFSMVIVFSALFAGCSQNEVEAGADTTVTETASRSTTAVTASVTETKASTTEPETSASTSATTAKQTTAKAATKAAAKTTAAKAPAKTTTRASVKTTAKATTRATTKAPTTTTTTSAHCTNNNNHSVACGNMGRWFNSKSDVRPYADSVMMDWGNKKDRGEITRDEYIKNCPQGYECWSCGYCGKWTGNLTY